MPFRYHASPLPGSVEPVVLSEAAVNSITLREPVCGSLPTIELAGAIW